MPLTNKQKMLLHVVPAGLRPPIDEAQRRVIQRTVGGFYSSADATATREGFVSVMAFYEDRSGGRLDGFSQGYWADARDKNERGEQTDRLTWRIAREAEALGWSADQVDAFLAGRHMSSGKCRGVADAPAYWLSRLLEALIRMNARCLAKPPGGATSFGRAPSDSGPGERFAGVAPSEGRPAGLSNGRRPA